MDHSKNIGMRGDNRGQPEQTENIVAASTSPHSRPTRSITAERPDESQNGMPAGMERDDVVITSKIDEAIQQASGNLEAKGPQEMSGIESSGEILAKPGSANTFEFDGETIEAQPAAQFTQNDMSQVDLFTKEVNQHVSSDINLQRTQNLPHELLDIGMTTESPEVQKFQKQLNMKRGQSNHEHERNSVYDESERIMALLEQQGVMIHPEKRRVGNVNGEKWTKIINRVGSMLRSTYRKDNPQASTEMIKKHVSDKKYDASLRMLLQEVLENKCLVELPASDQEEGSQDDKPGSSFREILGISSGKLRKLLAPENIPYVHNFVNPTQLPSNSRTTVTLLFAFLYLLTQREWNPDLLKVKMNWFLKLDKLRFQFPNKTRHMNYKKQFLLALEKAMLDVGEMYYNQRNLNGPDWVIPAPIEGCNPDHPQFKDVMIPFFGWDKREDRELLIFTKMVLGKTEKDKKMDEALIAKGGKAKTLSEEMMRLLRLTSDLPALVERINGLRLKIDEEVDQLVKADKEAKLAAGILELEDEELNEEQWVERHTYYYVNNIPKQKRLIEKAHKRALLAGEIQNEPVEQQVAINPAPVKPGHVKSGDQAITEEEHIEEALTDLHSNMETKAMENSKGKDEKNQECASQKEDDGFVTADEGPPKPGTTKRSLSLQEKPEKSDVSSLVKSSNKSGHRENKKLKHLDSSSQNKLVKSRAVLEFSEATLSHTSKGIKEPSEKSNISTCNSDVIDSSKKIPTSCGATPTVAEPPDASTLPAKRRLTIKLITKPKTNISPLVKKNKYDSTHSRLGKKSVNADSEEGEELPRTPPARVRCGKRKVVVDSDSDEDWTPDLDDHHGGEVKKQKMTARGHRK